MTARDLSTLHLVFNPARHAVLHSHLPEAMRLHKELTGATTAEVTLAQHAEHSRKCLRSP